MFNCRYARRSWTAEPTNRPARAAQTRCVWISTKTQQAAPPRSNARWQNSRRSNSPCIPNTNAATKRLARHFGVKPGELLLTNGGDDALRLFFDAFVDSGSSVVICEPTFPMYRYWGDCRSEDRSIALRISDGVSARKRPERSGCHPRAVFICNPNNPTGTLLSKETIETILKAATRTVVVVDEAYAEFSAVSTICKIQEYPQLFVATTFSKAAGLAGLRLGAVIACADSLSILRRATAPFPVNVAALAAAEAAVSNRKPETLCARNPPHAHVV